MLAGRPYRKLALIFFQRRRAGAEIARAERVERRVHRVEMGVQIFRVGST